MIAPESGRQRGLNVSSVIKWWKGRRNSAPYAQAYYSYLVSEFELIAETRVSDKARRRYEKITSEADPDRPSWEQIYALELLLQELYTYEELVEKSKILLVRYEEIAGEVGFKKYLETSNQVATAFPVTSGSAESRLRSSLRRMLQDLFWLYRIRTEWERLRGWFAVYYGLVAAGFLIATGFIVRHALSHQSPTSIVTEYDPWYTLSGATIAGATGACVSILRRLNQVPAEGSRLLKILEMRLSGGKAFVQSLTTGAVFALVLTFMFAGGFLSGLLFPNFRWSEDQEVLAFLDWIGNISNNGVEFSKLLVWCFMSGFAERVVPDFLDRLTNKAIEAEKALSKPSPLDKPPGRVEEEGTEDKKKDE